MNEYLKYFHEYRVIKQNLFYFEDGADIYYKHFKNKTTLKNPDKTDYYFNFITKYINKSDNIGLVILGCGNSEREAKLLKEFHKNEYKITYYGVDSAMSMLSISYDELRDCPYENFLVFADFSSEEFKNDVRNLTVKYDDNIYAFIDGTLGNVQQNHMADTLNDIVRPGEKLWIEVIVKEDNTLVSEKKMFDKMYEVFFSENFMNFLLSPMKNMGIDLSRGKMGLEMQREESLNSLKFVSFFKIETKTDITIRNSKVTLLPGSTIELLNVMVYDSDALSRFFEERGFEPLDRQRNGDREQFLFRKLPS